MMDGLEGESAPLLRRRSSVAVTVAGIDDAVDGKQGDGISTVQGACIVGSIGLLILLQTVNMTMLTTIASPVAEELDAYESVTWFTSAYLVAMSSVSPLIGRLSQIFSPRNCIVVSTTIVALGSIVTGLSHKLATFLIGRAITGAGSGGILTCATIIVIHMAPIKTRGFWLGLTSVGMTVGVSLGAVLGGALEPHFGWHLLFAAQAPLALVAGTCLFFALPRHIGLPTKSDASETIVQQIRRVDYLGAMTLTSGIVLLLTGLSARRILLLPLILSIPALAAFVMIETYLAREPIIPVSVLKSRGVLLTCFATVGFMMSRWAVLFYSPVYALAVRQWDPAIAGTILLSTNGGFGLGGFLAGWLHIRRDGSFYTPSLLTMSLIPLSILGLALLSTPTSKAGLFIVFLFLDGFLTGSAINYTTVHVLHLAPALSHPIILSLLATFRGFAGSFGSAMGGGLFTRILDRALEQGFSENDIHKPELIRRLLGSPALVKGLTRVEKTVAVQGYQTAVKGLFLAAVVLSVLMVFLQAGTGWRGHDDKAENDHINSPGVERNGTTAS